jgi:hypothetical protein
MTEKKAIEASSEAKQGSRRSMSMAFDPSNEFADGMLRAERLNRTMIGTGLLESLASG